MTTETVEGLTAAAVGHARPASQTVLVHARRPERQRALLEALEGLGTEVLVICAPQSFPQEFPADLGRFDILIVDAGPRGETLGEALVMVRAAHRPGGPDLVVTGAPLGDAVPVERLLTAGASDVLPDPLVMPLLRNRVRRLLAARTAKLESQLYRRAVEVSTSGIAITDARLPDNPIIWVSPAFETVTGYPAAEAIGRNCRFLHGNAPNSPERAILRAAVRDGRPCRVVVKNHRRDGTSYWNEVTLSPVQDAGGALTHFVGLQTDVTDRVRASELDQAKGVLETLVAERTADLTIVQRREEERRSFTEVVLDNITAGVLTADQAGAVTFANRLALDTLHLDVERCIGSHVRDLFPDAEDLREALEEDSALPERRFEISIRMPGGPPHDVGLSLLTLANRFEGVKHIVVFRDLASRRQHELELRRVEGLVALGQMAAGFAHELRNPLAAIRSLSEMLLSDLPEHDPHREYAERTQRLVRRMERLVTNSLRFGQPRPPAPQPHDPIAVLKEALEILEPRLKVSGARPSVLSQGEGRRVLVDEGQIVEVLVVLIENALDAAGKPERVQLVVRPDALDGREYIRIEVTDTGPGIDPQIITRIFDPFFTTKPKGTGLGLSIAQRLVRENLGHLLAQSVPGEGSTFTVLLPVDEATP